MLVREPTRGLEPLTTALQERCAASCATSAVHVGVTPWVPDHRRGLRGRGGAEAAGAGSRGGERWVRR